MPGGYFKPAQAQNVNRAQTLNDRSRLDRIRQLWRSAPGSQPNGTGTTGLNPADGQGWAKQQDDNVWAMNMLRPEDDPMDVRLAPQRSMAPSLAGLYQALDKQQTLDTNDATFYSQQERRRKGTR